jgi:predicted AAA+ superfamily ATPase
MEAAMIQRKRDLDHIRELIDLFPVTAVLGARQSGKTTLVGQIKANHFFDLENPRDIARLDNPQITLENLSGLIVIDEVQRKPDLFPLLRFLVDKNKSQRYLILGSASRDLVKHSSESLAGRIGYYHLAGLSLEDVGAKNWRTLLLRGGYPRAFLAKEDKQSFLWLEQYITTFLEKDIPQLGIQIPSHTLRRFWMMISHYHGQLINFSEIGRSFGISDVTVRKYTDILEGTFMVRILMPWHNNTSKRLIKSPKLYLNDSGIFHSLQSIETESELWAHPKLGASWEGFALEQTIRAIGKDSNEVFFWGTQGGAELDLFWKNKGTCFGAEFKYMDAPVMTKSMSIALHDLELEHLYVIYPGNQSYQLDKQVSVMPLDQVWSKFGA